MDLAPVADYDPAYRCVVGPIARWARRAWVADLATRHQLQRLWVATTARLRGPLLSHDHSALWKAVCGPTSALVATLARLRWQMHSAFTWTTHLGRRVDVLTLAPLVVASLARQATHDWLFSRVAATQPTLALLAGGAETQVTRRLTTGRTSTYWSPKHQGALACTASGGVWLEARKHSAGYTATALCQGCGTALGTLQHRLYNCPLLDPWRSFALDFDTIEAGRMATDDHPLYCRGLLPSTWLPHWTRCTDGPALSWTARGDDGSGTLSGHVFTDGSLVCPDQPRYCAGGWSVVQIHPSTHRVQVAYQGRVPFDDLDSTACEIYALLMSLAFVCGHITVHVDNAEVVHGMSRGKEYGVSTANKHAHLWRLVWAKIEDLGGSVEQWLSVVHVLAHTSQADVDAGVLTAFERSGNARADVLARTQAKLAGPPPEVLATVARLLSAQKCIGLWIGEATVRSFSFIQPDSTPAPAVRLAPKATAPRAQAPPPPAATHGPPRLVRTRLWSKTTPLAACRYAKDGDAVRARALGHSAHRTAEVLWCSRCGTYADGRKRWRAAGLTRWCTGLAATIASSRQRLLLLRGRHPVTRAALEGTCAQAGVLG
jgi:ribonuclease HI